MEVNQVNQKEIIHPIHEEEEEEREKEEKERCLKASQNPCFPSLAPKSQKKQESLLPHTNPFFPSSSSWEDCFPPPSHHHVFPDNVIIPHPSSNPFLPPSTEADDPCPDLEEVPEKSHEELGPNSFHDLPAKEKEKKEVSDSGGDADHGQDQGHHHHKKWFSFPKLDPRHRWPQGWC